VLACFDSLPCHTLLDCVTRLPCLVSNTAWTLSTGWCRINPGGCSWQSSSLPAIDPFFSHSLRLPITDSLFNLIQSPLVHQYSCACIPRSVVQFLFLTNSLHAVTNHAFMLMIKINKLTDYSKCHLEPGAIQVKL
jgi:hypothetical protein